MKVSVTVRFTSIFAEKVSEIIPQPLQYHTQLTLPSGDIEKSESKLRVPFVFNMTTTPLIATITLKGYVLVTGPSNEINNIFDAINKKKPPQSIFLTTLHYTLTEAIIMSREIGIPPPIPIPQPSRGEHFQHRSLTHETI
ncbi:MAG: hypothetical protein J7J78_00435 [Thermoprotei archaeon]|nr:hypothetical protein [Thermoprotei archaeon]OYT52210.1 MAG: hypothetical protein B6U76_10130 [Desulfurococcales archaeon ex4484_217_2]